MSDFRRIPAVRLQRLRRRADTLKCKAEDMLLAMIDEIGSDNTETDFPDAVLERAQELCEMLDRWAAHQRGKRP